MRTGQPRRLPENGTKPRVKKTATPNKEPRKDTSTDWVTIPRLVTVFIVGLTLTIYFLGV